MRLVRAPLRISIGGGGTDLPFYCTERGGDLTFATIDKYIYLTVNGSLENKYSLYLDEEFQSVENIDKLSNHYVKETFGALNIQKEGLSISSTSDVPSGTGLGSSGAFTVALLKALEKYSDKKLNQKEIAEKAFKIESKHLGKSCGKQDHYASSFGGIKRLRINEKNIASVNNLKITKETLEVLQNNLLLFYTDQKRYSEEILAEQKLEMTGNKSKMKKMDKIKKIGNRIRKELEQGDLSAYGQLLDRHWKTKKKFTEKMTNPKIDEMYSKSLEKGAKGGKIIGAGGGGFLMLFASQKHHEGIINALRGYDAKHMKFNFENEGCKILHDD